jgi:mono/diheme cytochrome c family protein
MKRISQALIAYCFGGLAMLLIAAMVTAAGGAETQRSHQTLLIGKALYMRYCSACHGTDGRGDGTVAPYLTPKPSDLTQLAKKNNGWFSFTRTLDAIDGTRVVRAHGASSMPVWGEVFLPNPNASPQEQIDARGRVQLITEYLRSIQVQ